MCQMKELIRNKPFKKCLHLLLNLSNRYTGIQCSSVFPGLMIYFFQVPLKTGRWPKPTPLGVIIPMHHCLSPTDQIWRRYWSLTKPKTLFSAEFWIIHSHFCEIWKFREQYTYDLFLRPSWNFFGEPFLLVPGLWKRYHWGKTVRSPGVFHTSPVLCILRQERSTIRQYWWVISMTLTTF